MSENDGAESPVSVFSDPPVETFCDTNILTNYFNQEWEASRGVELVEADQILIVVSEQVQTELNELVDRRRDLYRDLVEYLLEQDGRIEEYSPSDYIPKNDYRHLQELQMELANEDRAEVLMRVREFIARYKQRADTLFSAHVHKVVLTASPFLFEMDLDDVIPNSSDAAIVAGAADWTSQGGSGVLITNDTSDIVDFRDEINKVIENHLGPESTLLIWRPTDVELSALPSEDEAS
jgi:predicted nucleic acid-binding protein